MMANTKQQRYNTYLKKYKNLNTWNKYNRVFEGQPRHNYFIYHPSYSSNNTVVQTTNDSALADEIIAKAGPYPIYMDPNYHSVEIGNVRKVISDGGVSSNGVVNYKVNNDPNPMRIIRPSNDEYLEQDIHVKYLRPPTPPEPGPIVIQERQLPQPPPAPPIYIRQYEPRQPTPPTLLVREQPPVPPKIIEPTYMEKILPAHPPPPRQVIIEKIPAKPPKPQTIIYEKWLPYKAQNERQIIVEKAPYVKPMTPPRNVIIEYEKPRGLVNKRYIDDGVYKIDNPEAYSSSNEVQYVQQLDNSHLPMEFVRRYRNSAPSAHQQQRLYQSLQEIREPTPNRPPTAPYAQHIVVEEISRPKTVMANSNKPRPGPVMYNSPWTTTYKSNFYDKGFPNGFY